MHALLTRGYAGVTPTSLMENCENSSLIAWPHLSSVCVGVVDLAKCTYLRLSGCMSVGLSKYRKGPLWYRRKRDARSAVSMISGHFSWTFTTSSMASGRALRFT